MTAVSAEEGSLSSKRSWNLKAETSFIYLNAGSAESAFGRTRQKSATGPLDLNGGPAHDGSGRHAPGLTTSGHPRNGLFKLSVILGRIGRMQRAQKSPWKKCGSQALPGSSLRRLQVRAFRLDRRRPDGVMTCACPTWNRNLPVRSAVTAAPMSDRCLSQRTWAQKPEWRDAGPLNYRVFAAPEVSVATAGPLKLFDARCSMKS
jgi:hypothetical protein